MTKKKQAQPTNLIVRHKARGYVSVPSAIFYDEKVSIKDRGLYATIMALPDDWNFTVSGLIEILPDGEDAIRAALRRLQQHGWVSYRRLFDSKGRITGTQWEIFDQKLSYITDDAEADDDEEESPRGENPDMDNPRGENPHVEKPHEENPAQFKQSLNLNLSLNTHTHTAAGGNSGVEEENTAVAEAPTKEKQLIDNFLADKCAELFLRLKPITNKQAALMLRGDRNNMCQLLLEMNAKAIEYEGRSTYDVYVTFKNCQFRRRKY